MERQLLIHLFDSTYYEIEDNYSHDQRESFIEGIQDFMGQHELDILDEEVPTLKDLHFANPRTRLDYTY